MKGRSLFGLMMSLGIFGAGVLAKPQSSQNPGDRVLMLDWSEASINSGDDGANPLGISEKLSRGNYYAATWIRPVAEVAVNELVVHSIQMCLKFFLVFHQLITHHSSVKLPLSTRKICDRIFLSLTFDKSAVLNHSYT